MCGSNDNALIFYVPLLQYQKYVFYCDRRAGEPLNFARYLDLEHFLHRQAITVDCSSPSPVFSSAAAKTR